MVDVNWSMRPETQFSGWLDYLEPESVSFCKRWLHYQAGCLRIFRRAPEGVGQSSQQQQRLPGPGEAALIHEICKLHSKFTFDDDEPRPEKDPDDPSAATLGIEFRWQGRMMRFRASHPKLQEKWIAVLSGGLRVLDRQSLIHEGRLAVLDTDGVAKEAWVSISHWNDESGTLRCSMWQTPTIAPNSEGLSDALEEQEPSAAAAVVGQWGSPAQLPSRAVGLDIPSPAALCRLYNLELVVQGSLPPAPILSVEHPSELGIEEIREVQSGFDEAGAHFSANEATEFQVNPVAGGGQAQGQVVRFRARTRAEMLDWLVTTRKEVTNAVEQRDDPVRIIHSLLQPLLQEAPLVDEDVHFVLFEHREKSEDAVAAALEEDEGGGGGGRPKGMPPLPSAPKPGGGGGGSGGAVGGGGAGFFYPELVAMRRKLEGKQVVPRSTLEVWCKGLQLERWLHYATMLQERGFALADVPSIADMSGGTFDEQLLRLTFGVEALGPRNRMLRSIRFMQGERLVRPLTAAAAAAPVSGEQDQGEPHMSFQIFLPETNAVVTLSLALSLTVLELKKQLLYTTQAPQCVDMRQKMVRKAEGPLKDISGFNVVGGSLEKALLVQPRTKQDRKRTKRAQTYTLKLVGRMEPFLLNTILEDEATLRSVPFVFYAHEHGITPRLMLSRDEVSALKHDLLLLTCGELEQVARNGGGGGGGGADEEGDATTAPEPEREPPAEQPDSAVVAMLRDSGAPLPTKQGFAAQVAQQGGISNAAAQFGDSQQLRDFLQIARAVEWMANRHHARQGLHGMLAIAATCGSRDRWMHERVLAGQDPWSTEAPLPAAEAAADTAEAAAAATAKAGAAGEAIPEDAAAAASAWPEMEARLPVQVGKKGDAFEFMRCCLCADGSFTVGVVVLGAGLWQWEKPKSQRRGRPHCMVMRGKQRATAASELKFVMDLVKEPELQRWIPAVKLATAAGASARGGAAAAESGGEWQRKKLRGTPEQAAAARAAASFTVRLHLCTTSLREVVRAVKEDGGDDDVGGLARAQSALEWQPAPMELTCDGDSTAGQLLTRFATEYEGGVWHGRMTEPDPDGGPGGGGRRRRRLLPALAIKLRKYADYFYRDDILWSYDAVREAIDEGVALELTVVSAPIVGALHEAGPSMHSPANPPCPPEIKLLVKGMAWLEPTALSGGGGGSAGGARASSAAAAAAAAATAAAFSPIPEGTPVAGSPLGSAAGAGSPAGLRQSVRRERARTVGGTDAGELSPLSLDDKLLRQLARDPAAELDEQLCSRLWAMRYSPELYSSTRLLPKMIIAVPLWSDPSVVKEAEAMVRRWDTLRPAEAMQLLDPLFWELCATPRKGFSRKTGLDPLRVFRQIKDYAVECLAHLADAELEIYLLELCQLMKREKLHNSYLVRFLLYRALRAPFKIGQALFWHLRSEMYEPVLFTLYGMFLRQYLERAEPHRSELVAQEEHIMALRQLVTVVKNTPSETRLAVLRDEMAELQFPPGGLLLPTGSNKAMRVTGFIVEKCKYMDSAQKPLWLVYVSADSSAPPLIVIFKDGDDVRQDILVLQMFNLMGRMWNERGMDIPLTVYGVASLGFEVGLVEVVENCDTLSNIVKNKGGASGVWDKTILAGWLREQCPDDEEYEVAIQTFLRSCAGYCVATYVLGVADRHNDNVMLAKSGHLLHIDFGHFLGHNKMAMGFNRDKSPFILTDDFVYILGGKLGQKSPNFAHFEMLCCELFNTLRQDANLFINLISIMRMAGLEELENDADVDFLRQRFMLSEDDDTAAQHFREQIQVSLNTLMTKLNWTAHILKHR